MFITSRRRRPAMTWSPSPTIPFSYYDSPLKHCLLRLIVADIYLCTYHEADEATVAKAIDGALAAKGKWESLAWNDRAAIFLKAADIVSGKYRYKLLAATILGQGKNVWQAEIDAAAEVITFSLSSFFIFFYNPTNLWGNYGKSSWLTFSGSVSSL